jgi:hypothetical protein
MQFPRREEVHRQTDLAALGDTRRQTFEIDVALLVEASLRSIQPKQQEAIRTQYRL